MLDNCTCVQYILITEHKCSKAIPPRPLWRIPECQYSLRRFQCTGSAYPPPRSHLYPVWAAQLSAVINRVRSAFGPIPMRGSATRPQVQRAEKVVDQTARQLLRGEADLSAWYRVLRQYEDAWMLELERVRGARAERCAA